MTPILETLLRSTILLALSGLLVGTLLRSTGCRSSRWTRTAWALVLIQGVILMRFPLHFAVLSPPPMETQAATTVEKVDAVVFQPQEKPFREMPNMPVVHHSQNMTPPVKHTEIVTPPVAAPTVQPVMNPMPVAETIPPRSWSEFFQANGMFLVFVVWVIGMLAFFAAQVISYWRLLRQTAEAEIPEPAFLREWEQLLAEHGIAPGKIKLLTAEQSGPGLIHRLTHDVVIVPTALWEEAPNHVRLGILKHELSHYLHRDLLKSLCLRVIALVHWFNPVAHFAVRKFDEAAEWRCDADAYGTSEHGTAEFAETLLLFRDTTPVAAVCRTAFCGNNVIVRAQRLSEYRKGQGDSLMKKALILLIGVSFLCVGMFQVKLIAKPLPNDPQQSNASQADEPKPEEEPQPPATDDSWKTIPPEMKVIVKNEAGEPVKDVELFLNIWGGTVEKTYRSTLHTDEHGIAVFDLADIQNKEFTCYRMWTTPKEKYVPQFMNRDRLNGGKSTVPAEYQIVLKPGILVGGTIVNEEGEPIQGAKAGEDFPRGTGIDELVTDAEGKWSTSCANPDSQNYPLMIRHPDYLDLKVTIEKGTPEMERFQNLTEKFVLKRGVNVSGKVVDADGQPIENAKVELGYQNRMFYHQGKEYYQETKTDAQGDYAFPATPTGPKNLIVSAPGKAPQIRQLQIAKSLGNQDFTLQPGNTIRFKIVDAAGKPIAGAYASPYTWQGSEGYLKYRDDGLKADEHGMIEWDEAPDGIVGYHFNSVKDGKLTMLPDKKRFDLISREEPYTITLYPVLVFSGKVIDKETKQPVNNFLALPGAKFDENYDRAIWQTTWARAGENGTYTVPIDSIGYAFAIRIEADGYLPAESEAFVGAHGEKIVDFELTPAAPIHGVILQPDGKPAQNVEVRMIDSKNGRSDIFNGDLKSRMYGEDKSDYMTTKEDGRFSFRPRQEGYVIICAHDSGCALAFREEAETGTITLKPWARIEATLMKGKEPRPNQAVSLFGGGYSCGNWDREKPLPLFQTPSTSDANGKVVFEKVYPGINYWLEMREHDFGSSSVDSFSNSLRLASAELIPEPGKTSQIQIGGTGCPVIGKVSLPEQFRDKINWKYAKITLSSIDPAAPKPDYANLPIPGEIDRNNRTEVLTWYWKWLRETDEGKAFEKIVNAYNLQCDSETGTCPISQSVSFANRVNDDGTFRIDDVTPGTYKIAFESFQPKTAEEMRNSAGEDRVRATRNQYDNNWHEPEITIPAIPGERTDKPFDAGNVRMELVSSW